eukprot:scaffold132491_cov31-Tisochrysis_lutea.AAC.6
MSRPGVAHGLAFGEVLPLAGVLRISLCHDYSLLRMGRRRCMIAACILAMEGWQGIERPSHRERELAPAHQESDPHYQQILGGTKVQTVCQLSR